MNTTNSEPLGTWIVCKNNRIKHAKLECHFDQSAAPGQQWARVTIDGDENGTLPDCREGPDLLGVQKISSFFKFFSSF